MTQLPTFTREQLETLDKEALIDIILELREVLVKQGVRIQALEDQLAKNSRNSSKPPSSDGLKKKPAPKSLREKGQRKTGGQTGHQGETRKRVSDPHHIEIHRVTRCPGCQADLSQAEIKGLEKRQVFAVPPIELEVTAHQAAIKCCPNCHSEVKATFPSRVTQAVQYGLRLQAQAVYLNSYQLLPLARICELFGDLYGHAPSEAFVLQASHKLVGEIEPSLRAIQTQVKQGDVVHCDESGMRVEGQLNWLHVAATDRLTYYAVHRKRGQEALRAIGILPDLQGRAIHDGWASYFQFDHCAHALCNAHHLRELRFIFEQYEQTWAAQMFELLLDIKKEVETVSSAQMSLTCERLWHYEQQYDALLRQGFAANPPPEHPPQKSADARNNRQRKTCLIDCKSTKLKRSPS